VSHIIDNEFYKHVMGTEEMRAVFDPRKQIQSWLEIVTALAKVQADFGIIPDEAAETISANANVDMLDLTTIVAGDPLPSLLQTLRATCSDAGQFVNFGLRDGDVEDTGTMLEIRDAYGIVFRDLKITEDTLRQLAGKHKTMPMAGRSHNQHGPPVTLGFKLAGWAAETRRNMERMKDLHKRLFVGLVEGETDTLEAFGDKSAAVLKGVMAELDLQVLIIGSGSARDHIAEFQNVLGLVAGGIGRIGNEIYQLSRSELFELHEPLGPEYVGSSAMPHKRNAEVSEFVVAQCRIVQQNAALGMQAMICEHERDSRSLLLDQHSIPESCVLLARAMESIKYILADLDISEDNMRRNMGALDGMIFSEALMYYLAPRLGKQTAHDLVLDACMLAHDTHTPIKQILLNDPVASKFVVEQEMDELMDYSKHIGKCPEQVDQVLAFAEAHELNDADYMTSGKT
jgi:adenylosuccinate lyase